MLSLQWEGQASQPQRDLGGVVPGDHGMGAAVVTPMTVWGLCAPVSRALGSAGQRSCCPMNPSLSREHKEPKLSRPRAAGECGRHLAGVAGPDPWALGCSRLCPSVAMNGQIAEARLVWDVGLRQGGVTTGIPQGRDRIHGENPGALGAREPWGLWAGHPATHSGAPHGELLLQGF